MSGSVAVVCREKLFAAVYPQVIRYRTSKGASPDYLQGDCYQRGKGELVSV